MPWQGCWRISLIFAVGIFCIGWGAGSALAVGVAQLDSTNPMTWLVKSVCTNSQNLAMAADPYYGCPAGAAIRKIPSGDPLPYNNVEQMGYQQRDAYPVLNPATGATSMIATFDYYPFNQFNLFNGTDGYDIYTLQNGWVSIANTSDGGGYGQTFYTSGCKIGGGWVLFPTTGFLKGGQARAEIADLYWEQSGQSYPGACPAKYSTTTLTSWKHQTGFLFGGVNGNPVKTMDTMISYHGFQSTPGFQTHGHLEVFYFTREYGITRWEVWTPTAQHPTATAECQVPATQTYQGMSFVVQSCHDWSQVRMASAAQRPVWPIPNTNLLAKPHFDGTISGSWRSEGQSTTGKPINWSVRNSTASRDTQASAIGVRYLQLDCSAGSTGQCGGTSEAVYQDIPTAAVASGANYAFGINVRTEPGRGQGTIDVAVQQIDGSGQVIANTTGIASATVQPDNGTPGRESTGEAASIYLSSSFVYGALTIRPQPNAAKIRFLISPQTPQIFDVLDAWLAAWPAPAGFATTP